MLKGIIIGAIIFLVIDFIIGLCVYFFFDKDNPVEVKPKEKKPKKEISEGAVKATMYLGFMPLSFFGSVVKLSKERKARKKMLRGLHHWWF